MHTAARRGRFIAAAVLVALLGAACTPDPAPEPTPTPTASSTPPETAQEREQRIAYAAAENSYRSFRTEFNRVLRGGGAAKPTATMTALAGNGYLKDTASAIEAFYGVHYHAVGAEVVVYARPDGYSPASLLLQTCEDTRGLKVLNKQGATVGVGELRQLSLTMKLDGGRWKIWTGTGKKVASCD